MLPTTVPQGSSDEWSRLVCNWHINCLDAHKSLQRIWNSLWRVASLKCLTLTFQIFALWAGAMTRKINLTSLPSAQVFLLDFRHRVTMCLLKCINVFHQQWDRAGMCWVFGFLDSAMGHAGNRSAKRDRRRHERKQKCGKTRQGSGVGHGDLLPFSAGFQGRQHLVQCYVLLGYEK